MEHVNDLSEFVKNLKNNYDDDQFSNLVLLAGARTVRRLRKTRNITQGEAAVISDISQSYLSNVEHAKHMLSIKKLLTLSVSIDLHPDDCFKIFSDELNYAELIYREFKDNNEKYEAYSSFHEFAQDNLEDNF